MKSLTTCLKALIPAAMLALSCSAFAQSSDDSESSEDVFEREREFWTCRADARDDSGLFFLGMGRTRADAYVQALEACNRQNRSCIINCQPGPGNW
jgi:hypothetical protein